MHVCVYVRRLFAEEKVTNNIFPTIQLKRNAYGTFGMKQANEVNFIFTFTIFSIFFFATCACLFLAVDSKEYENQTHTLKNIYINMWNNVVGENKIMF